MNRRETPTGTVAACVVSLLLATAAAAAPRWTEIRSANFLLAGDAGERDIRDVARRLEEFREALSRLLPSARFPSTPTIVLVFANKKSYDPFRPVFKGKPVDVSGFYQTGLDATYVTMVLGTRDDPYPIIFHEFTHVFVSARLEHAPLWFSEGIAEYYSSFQVSSDGKHASVGRMIEPHVLLLRRRWLPLGEVLAAGHDSPLYNTSANRNVFYAESWALTHYFLIGDPAKRSPLFAFLDRVGAGAPVEQACREGFGMPVSAMENELRNYVQQLAFPSQVVTFAEPIASRASAPGRVLADSAVDARLGDFLMNMDRREEAEARLQRALAANPNEIVALLSLGELRFRQERESDALEYLARAASLDQNSYEAQWAYGRALLRRVSGPPTAAALEKARAACARALELRPDSADATGGLALADLAAGERLDEAKRLAERAAQLDPSEPTHLLLLAQVLASQRNFAAARATLGPLMASQTPEIRDQARALMSRVITYETSAARPPDKETAASGSTLVPLLRPLKEGEQRAFGSLERIECGPGGNLLVVKAGDRVLRLSVPRTHTLDFISYRDDLRGDVACGARKPPDPVYVTWKPAPPGPAGSPDGEAVAVEFVPKDFVPKQAK